jgi:hypothetical protein
MKKHAAAAKLWAEALDSDPKLADDRKAQHRYNAACAAALAASQQSVDDPPRDDDASVRLREQALGWLRSELAAWGKLVVSGPPQSRSVIAQALEHWRKDADLASVREPDAVASLPDVERDSWKSLWSKVDDLLAEATSRD